MEDLTPTAGDRPATLTSLAFAWALATGIVALADMGLSRSLGQSLVTHGLSLPGRLPPLLGWALLGAGLPLALEARGEIPRALDRTLAPLSAAVVGVGLHRQQGLPWGSPSQALLIALALGTPVVTAVELVLRRDTLDREALARGVVAIALVALSLACDPASGAVRSWGPYGIVFTASLAALGATTPTGLLARGLPVAALVTWVFWTCAFWLLLGNSGARRYGVGFLSQWIS